MPVTGSTLGRSSCSVGKSRAGNGLLISRNVVWKTLAQANVAAGLSLLEKTPVSPTVVFGEVSVGFVRYGIEEAYSRAILALRRWRRFMADPVVPGLRAEEKAGAVCFSRNEGWFQEDTAAADAAFDGEYGLVQGAESALEFERVVAGIIAHADGAELESEEGHFSKIFAAQDAIAADFKFQIRGVIEECLPIPDNDAEGAGAVPFEADVVFIKVPAGVESNAVDR